jgi:hypothetical protein
VETVLLVANGADGAARGRTEARRVDDFVAVLVLLEQRVRYAHFPGNHDAIGGAQNFCRNAYLPGVKAGLAGLLVDKIDNLVGDAVAHLVGVTFGNRFAGEEVILSRHGLQTPREGPDDTIYRFLYMIRVPGGVLLSGQTGGVKPTLPSSAPFRRG